MFFEQDITIPANTPRTAPKTTRIRLKVGIIHHVAVQFPAGCAGLAAVQIFEGKKQIFPTTPGDYFKADDYTVEFDDAFPVQKGGTLWLIDTWNTDDTYPHTVTVRFGVLQEAQLWPLYKMYKAIQLFFKLFRRRT